MKLNDIEFQALAEAILDASNYIKTNIMDELKSDKREGLAGTMIVLTSTLSVLLNKVESFESIADIDAIAADNYAKYMMRLEGVDDETNI